MIVCRGEVLSKKSWSDDLSVRIWVLMSIGDSQSSRLVIGIFFFLMLVNALKIGD